MNHRRLHHFVAYALTASALVAASPLAMAADNPSPSPGSAATTGASSTSTATPAGANGLTGAASSTSPTTGAANNPASPDNAESKPTAGPGSTSPGNATAAPDDKARRLFDQLDANHDGVLSFEEFSRTTIRRQ